MISAVIPVYNEASCLEAGVHATRAVLQHVAGADSARDGDPKAWEILLVDDGSSDGTGALMARLEAEDPHIRALSHSVNQGKGAAVRTGVLATRGDFVLFCDADLSTPPEFLSEFLQVMERGADVVIGNRKSAAATIERWQPPLRTWLGLGFTRLANRMMGLSVGDYTCGFKLFRGDAARRVFQRSETSRWSFDVEILALAAQEGLRVEEVPVRWHNDPDTRVRVLRDVISSFRELIAIRRRLGRRPPPPS
ncbi:MAG: glycosyl transferase [Planctomycetota bacterium]|nr:MAG: glycosyl transferase [Planctomycetota bacterium]